jgi:tetratricopeptide (TPR) repeat protein
VKKLLWVVVGALAVTSGCKCGEKDKPAEVVDAGVQDAGVVASVTDTVKLVREADAAFQSGRLDEAIEKSEAALRQAPTHALALNVLGRASAAKFDATKEQKFADKARDAFKRAAAANPGFWPALQNLAELAEKEGKLEEAAGYYKQVLAAEPNHPEKARFEKLIAGAQPKKDGGK